MGASELILAELKRGGGTAKDIAVITGVTLKHAHSELWRLAKDGRAHVAIILKKGRHRVGSVYMLGPAPPGFVPEIADAVRPAATMEERAPRVNSIWQLADLMRCG